MQAAGGQNDSLFVLFSTSPHSLQYSNTHQVSLSPRTGPVHISAASTRRLPYKGRLGFNGEHQHYQYAEPLNNENCWHIGYQLSASVRQGVRCTLSVPSTLGRRLCTTKLPVLHSVQLQYPTPQDFREHASIWRHITNSFQARLYHLVQCKLPVLHRAEFNCTSYCDTLKIAVTYHY